MKTRLLPLAAFLLSVWACSSSLAAKPEWAGGGNGNKQQGQKSEKQEVEPGKYFVDAQRQAVAEYYGAQQAKGHCPPGLAKKKNGCMPPGQAKKWSRGKALPATVTRYPVPGDVIVRIGPPPAGCQYVRVANDILLIAVGTQLVVDAIEDLMRP